MKIQLTCGYCLHEWVVERWVPAMQRCPQCGRETLADGHSRREAERIAKEKARAAQRAKLKRNARQS